MALFNFKRVIELFTPKMSNQHKRQFSPERYMTALSDEEEREYEIEEARRQEASDKKSLEKYVLSLIETQQFEKARPFLLGEGREKFHENLDKNIYLELQQNIPPMLLNQNRNDVELNTLLDIINDPFIMKKSLNTLHNEFAVMAKADYAMYDNYARVLFTHLLENSYSAYLDITKKMFSFDHKGDTLEYVGMSNLSEVEKKLINTQFLMIEHLHDGVDFMKPYTHPETKIVPCNDLVVLAFLHEKPQYHGSPILLKNHVVASDLGVHSFFLEKYESHFKKEFDFSSVREISETYLEKYMSAFKNGGISDNIHQEYLKKFQQVMGNDMDKALSETDLPLLFQANLSKKYNEIISLEKTHDNEDFRAFLDATKKSLINFVQFYPSLSSIQSTEEIREVLKSLIQNIETNTETFQVEMLSNFQKNQSIQAKVLRA